MDNITRVDITPTPSILPNQQIQLPTYSSTWQEANALAHMHLNGFGYPTPAQQARCEAQQAADWQTALNNAFGRLINNG